MEGTTPFREIGHNRQKDADQPGDSRVMDDLKSGSEHPKKNSRIRQKTLRTITGVVWWAGGNPLGNQVLRETMLLRAHYQSQCFCAPIRQGRPGKGVTKEDRK